MKISVGRATLLCSIFFLVACQSEYTKLVENELASGAKNDSIFYDFKFGQSKSEFYNSCWEYNKKKIFTHGPSNNYVQTILKPKDSSNVKDKIRMLFYAKFNAKDEIIAMDVKFSHVAWAPWNKELHADKLLPKVKDTLMKWYPGNEFIKVKDVYVKVDGNRQIRVKEEDTKDVSVIIEDMDYRYKELTK
ncbi:hypothetical protein [Winogradskyella alexanderae]|uniref:Beta-lactamase-inhibitor-like PepSY-like domain-containing protein n=1 Tax=Winogradskyella alexanderae TaxID=2877123 RepID=A0ABS7XR86_9FLAO|nr:hypothetical protein [Winogradskyella alexanderae]MCA0132513.1 hypothetical protein [Winogradskyella alexanderae]